MLARFSVDTRSIPAQVVYFQLNLEGSNQSVRLGHEPRPVSSNGQCSLFAAFRLCLEASRAQLLRKADAAKQVGKAGVAP
jgi:hypothetical protein